MLEMIGEMLMSQRVFRTERSEKMMEATGRDGKQAALPSESPMQEESIPVEESLRIPRKSSQRRRITSSGDSKAPAIAFTS